MAIVDANDQNYRKYQHVVEFNGTSKIKSGSMLLVDDLLYPSMQHRVFFYDN